MRCCTYMGRPSLEDNTYFDLRVKWCNAHLRMVLIWSLSLIRGNMVLSKVSFLVWTLYILLLKIFFYFKGRNIFCWLAHKYQKVIYLKVDLWKCFSNWMVFELLKLLDLIPCKIPSCMILVEYCTSSFYVNGNAQVFSFIFFN